ncbi:MAG: hypothetical protein R2856_34860 [Caldilineaceae bacterium]
MTSPVAVNGPGTRIGSSPAYAASAATADRSTSDCGRSGSSVSGRPAVVVSAPAPPPMTRRRLLHSP